MTVYTTVMTETVDHELYSSGAVVKRGKREDEEQSPQDMYDRPEPSRGQYPRVGVGSVQQRRGRHEAPQGLDRRRAGGGPDGHEGRWRKYWNWNGIDSKPRHVPPYCLLTRRDM